MPTKAEALLHEARLFILDLEWSARVWGDDPCCPSCGRLERGLPESPGHPLEPPNTHRDDCEWLSLTRRMQDADQG